LNPLSEYYSRPRRIISDRGTCFTSFEFSSFLSERNIGHVKVATAAPQANGQVERINRVLTPMLGKLSEPIGTSWSTELNLQLIIPFRRVLEKLLELSEYLEDNPCDITSERIKASDNINRSQVRNESLGLCV